MRKTAKTHEKDPTMHQLYLWINSFQNIQGVSSIQYLSTGIPYCLIINAFYEQTLPFIKIKQDAATDIERRANFKLLSEAMKKTDLYLIQIDIPKLLSTSIFQHKKLLMKLYQKLSTKKFKLDEARTLQNQNQTPLKMYRIRTPQSHNERSYTKEAKPCLSVKQIKEVIGKKDITDREKVKMLKKMLQISDDLVEKEIHCFNEIRKEEDSDNLLENSNQIEVIVVDERD